MPRHKHKLYSGGLLILIGLAAAAGSFEYNVGSLARMGPGYYPLLLGITLMLLGLFIIVTPDSSDEVIADQRRVPLRAIVRKHARPWCAVVSGMITFIIIGKWGGLVPATFALVFVSALGDRTNSLATCFLLAVGITISAAAIFHYALQLQFPLFSWG